MANDVKDFVHLKVSAEVGEVLRNRALSMKVSPDELATKLLEQYLAGMDVKKEIAEHPEFFRFYAWVQNQCHDSVAARLTEIFRCYLRGESVPS